MRPAYSPVQAEMNTLPDREPSSDLDASCLCSLQGARFHRAAFVCAGNGIDSRPAYSPVQAEVSTLPDREPSSDAVLAELFGSFVAPDRSDTSVTAEPSGTTDLNLSTLANMTSLSLCKDNVSGNGLLHSPSDAPSE